MNLRTQTRAQKTQYEIAHELGFYKPMTAKPKEFSMAVVVHNMGRPRVVGDLLTSWD